MITTYKIQIWALTAAALTSSAFAQGTGNDSPTGVGTAFVDYIRTAGSYDPYTGSAVREITDLEVAGSVGAYPLKFTRTMMSRVNGAVPWWFGTGAAWVHQYGWDIASISGTDVSPNSYTVNYPNGKQIIFNPSTTDPFMHGPSGIRDRLQQSGTNPNDFYLHLTDGGRIYFRRTRTITYGQNLPPTNTYADTFRAESIIDPYGQTTQLLYTTANPNRLWKIMEPAGRWIQINYGNVPWNASFVITSVSSSDGRTVTYQYIKWGTNVTTLMGVAYDDATTASYSYQASNNSSSTRPLPLEMNDVRFAGPMRHIRYQFVPGGTYGVVQDEKTGDGATSVSHYQLTTHTETRGDGPTRTFTYSGYFLTGVTDFNAKSYTFTYDAYGFLKTAKDPLLHTTTFTRESYAGQITKVTNPDATFSTIQYTMVNRPYYVSQTTDENGKTTIYKRDASNRIYEIDYPDTAYETFTYNTFGQILAHRMRNGATESFTYTTDGLKQTHTDGAGKTWTYTYDALDRLVSVKNPRNYTTQLEYTARGLLSKATNPNLSFTTATYDIYGNRLTATNELSKTTTFTYDEFNRLLTKSDPLSRVTTWNYAKSGQSSYAHTTNAYSTMTSPGGGVTTVAYDNNFRKSSLTVANGTSDAATTTFAYDFVGNLTILTDSLSNIYRYSYDGSNRPQSATDPLTISTQWGRDGVGNIVTEIGPSNTVTTFTYDSMNRLIQTDDPLHQLTKLTYNAGGNIATLTDPKNNVYAFAYDGNNHKLSMTYPNTSVESCTYDADGNLATFTNRAGNIRTFTYDPRDREVNASWNVNGETYAKTYDAASHLITNNCASSAITYTYDAADQVVTNTQTITGLSAKAISYAYDLDGNRISTTYPNGSVYTWTYNGRNQINAINDGGATPIVAYAYDLAGNRTSRTLRNGITTASTYDSDNRLFTHNHQLSGTTFASLAYGYNNLSNRTYAKREDGKGEAYGYDLTGQVKQVKYDALNVDTTPLSPARTVDYLYDPAGNWSSLTDNGSTSTYTANNLNAYTAAAAQSVGYDANGNVNSYNGWSYTHNADNKLVSQTSGSNTVSYNYDSFPHNIKKVENGSARYFLYDADMLIAEYDSAGNNDVSYVGGADIDEFACRIISGVKYYYLYDALGSVTHYTNSTGGVLEKYSYDVFGTATFKDANGNVISASAYGQRFLFTGRKQYTALDSIYDYRNRAYSPMLGRFFEPDPLGFEGGVNLYGYCDNNAANDLDPFGLQSNSDNGFSAPASHYEIINGTIQKVDSNGHVIPLQGSGSPSAGNEPSSNGGNDGAGGSSPSYGFYQSQADLFAIGNHARIWSHTSIVQRVQEGPGGVSVGSFLTNVLLSNVNSSAGLADSLSLGITSLLRSAFGIDSVQTNTSTYKVGSILGMGAGLIDGEGEMEAGKFLAKYVRGSARSEFPSQLLRKSINEIKTLAKENAPGAKTALKLLFDGRFRKGK